MTTFPLRRPVRRLTAILAAAAAFVVFAPGMAVATAQNISGDTSSSTWVVYTTTRTTTGDEGGRLSGAGQLLLNGDVNLSLRVHRGDGSQWTNPQHWSFEDRHVRKDFTTGVASGQPFRMAACCVTTGGNQTWQARIWY